MVDIIVDSSTSSAYFEHEEDISKKLKCEKCMELKRQLKEVVIELSSAKLIIKLLQKETNMSMTSDSTYVRSDLDFCKEDYQEVNKNNSWTIIPSKHPTKKKTSELCHTSS
jgi:hypothetical protein